MPVDIDELAGHLLRARRDRRPLGSLTPPGTKATISDAFRIQQEVVRQQVRQGDKVAGFKLGNIAKAMQSKFGVDQPDFGYLLSSQFHYENLRLSPETFIDPYVELEPAFVLKGGLGGEHVTVADVISATDYVLPSLEIIDSRIEGWNIGIFETLADCGSTGAIILGAKPRRLSEVDLADISGEIHVDGNVVAQGNTADIFGNPVSAIAWLCRRVAEFGVEFQPGNVILPGSCLAAVSLIPNTRVTGSFAGWGSVSFEYGGDS
ncbi:2-keto-4-pentenoate hydratase [Arthrobacter sp. ISL-30]|uniref:2-keto-4-pentenoate hydratase n=1 Tax=Arthrobacter sp. ISL-30 TaxID=2819109 RepID=UPI001BE74526|nr:2-hydroxypenta-2,4-dienoate hydratase [Arthrobacter sp. ISL-30]MBT2515680.1 2-hydroxypenta-2,4-dienoate hydratase [Arthrobacter sp. ISL-30]